MNAKTLAVVLLGIGFALVAGGLVVGLIPLHAGSGLMPVKCGSAFAGSDAAAQADTTASYLGWAPTGNVAACASERSTWRVIAILLLVLGVASCVGGIVAGSIRTAAAPSTKAA